MAIKLSAEALRKVFPDALPDYIEAIVSHLAAMEKAGISTDKRVRHFLAQGAAETGGFTIKVESGSYSAEGLLKTFPKYFKSLAEAKAYAKRPKAIFNRVYADANRSKQSALGNTGPNDGYTYRGRGIFQITGKAAYAAYGKRLGLDFVNKPDLAAEPANSIQAAILYWTDLGLNAWADKDDILAVSRGINGGNPKRNIQPNGMTHRRAWYARLKTLALSGGSVPEVKVEPGTLREGDEGSEVSKLQSALRAKGYNTGAIDGVFGANTAKAVISFQIDHAPGAVGGIWRPEYWPLLDAAPNIQEERQSVTAKDLRAAGDPLVTQVTFLQRLLLWFGIGGALTGGASEGASNFPALVTQYQPILDTISPPIRWAANNGWLLVAILCFVGFIALRYLVARIVKAYKHGDYQGQYKDIK